MYHVSQLPVRVAERARTTLTAEEFSSINDDEFLRALVVDAAGRETAHILQQVRDTHKDYFNSLDADAYQAAMHSIFDKILAEVLADSAIAQSVAILKGEVLQVGNDARHPGLSPPNTRIPIVSY